MSDKQFYDHRYRSACVNNVIICGKGLENTRLPKVTYLTLCLSL
jgi:hypothetical protein